MSEVVQRRFPQADPAEMLETIIARSQECQCHTVPVTRGGALVGVVTSENLGAFLMIQAALKERAVIAPPTPGQASVQRIGPSSR